MKLHRAHWSAPVRITLADSPVGVGVAEASWLLSPDQARYLTVLEAQINRQTAADRTPVNDNRAGPPE